ncbi:hypothetical protein HanPSC8_Chr08g0307621 [Helianthus annuus]|nr:hypothetical protein HanPSC8_Chr08g0307621 [Helianthus annuus]
MADGDDNDAVLSDVEEDDNPPAPIVTGPISSIRTRSLTDDVSNNVSIERFRELLTELDRERQAREAVEKAKSELQVSFNRLKVLAHEAIKKRDEVVRSNEKLSVELAETVKEKEELMKQKEEVVKELEESVKAKEGVKSEIGTAAQMLVTGIDKISGKVNRFKNFTAGGLPRSQKYTGLPATSVVERLENLNEEKDEMMGELETELKEKQDLVSEYGDKLRVLEERMDSQRPLLVDQLSHVSKIHDRICEVVKVIDGDKKADLSDSLFLPQETDLEENIRASLAGLESINELSSMALEKVKDFVAERSREVKGLNETVTQLTREKEHIGSLLRSALSRRMSADPSLKTNELFKVAEKGLRESGVNYKFNNHTGHEKTVSSNKDGNVKLDDDDDDEISTLAGALENIIKQSQIEIIELQHSVDELRAESSLLKERVEAQAKELLQSKQKLEELEAKERVANENVEGLMMDIAAAEEEITRWKVAAQQEAAAGKAVEQDYVAQLHTIRQELEEAKQSVIESEKKLKFKEETAAAAMSARDAAESSLKLADTRAARLRERVEELTSQLEELDTRRSLINGKRPRYICWPWQWLGLDPIGPRQLDTHEHTSNEMELSEPLL